MVLRTICLFLIFALILKCVVSNYNEINEVENNNQCIGNDKQPICITAGCIHTASEILKSLDQSVEPCDDFYKFVCGNFIKHAIIPEDELTVAKFTDTYNLVHQQLRNIIEEPSKFNEPKPFMLLKQLYHLCMDTQEIENNGLDPLKLIIQNLGGWPILDDYWDEKSFDWKDAVYKLRREGFTTNVFLSTTISDDTYNKSRRIIYLDEVDLPLHREYLTHGFSHEIVKAYYQYLKDVAVIFGADSENATKDLKDSVNFQIELAKITVPNEKRRNFTALTNMMKIRDLKAKFPNFPWLEYINKVLGTPGITVEEDEDIDVTILKFISDLLALLERTPKRVQANYVVGRVVLGLAPLLTKDLKARALRFDSIAYGAKELPARWKECVMVSTKRMPIAASALYIRRYFDEDARKSAVEMLHNIKRVFIAILKQVDWMDETTKTKAIEKATTMKAHVAYPKELLNDTKIEEYYKNMEPSGNYLTFMLSISKFLKDKQIRTLREPVDKADWRKHSTAIEVNAGYIVAENSIVFPAGILQGVFFNHERPNYMNYGGIGFVIGHEITHGFDDQGRQVDKDGLLVNWWSKETAKTFTNKAQCFIEQYGNYRYSELNVNLNGINTQGENIADNGGIKEAYLAYNAWVASNGEEPLLPGLNYTQRQMFWISAANVWCSKERIEVLKRLIVTDNHPPPYFRVIGSFSNSEYFATDFQCPSGSRMNPRRKCCIW